MSTTIKPKSQSPPVVLFGYESSPFTTKVRMALKLKQVPYIFVTVPSMMPRPVLRDNFNLTYRKIPVLAIGKEVIYVDTSLILEAIEYCFPISAGYGSIYPAAANGRSYRGLARGFSSYWTDRPFFRVMTGLIPPDVWRTAFGVDRAQLIGHKLDPEKLEKKVPQNLSGLDLHLSILEPMLPSADEKSSWIFDTKTPSIADIAFFYQLDWGRRISQGEGVEDLVDALFKGKTGEGIKEVFNDRRYPNISRWFERMTAYFEGLPNVEEKVNRNDDRAVNNVLQQLQKCEEQSKAPMLPTPSSQHETLDHRNELVTGVTISIAPDDTGRDDPVIGVLAALSAEEVVINPQSIDGKGPTVENIRIHFPRLGFVVKPLSAEKTTKARL